MDDKRLPSPTRHVNPFLRRLLLWYWSAWLWFATRVYLRVKTTCARRHPGPILDTGMGFPEFRAIMYQVRYSDEKLIRALWDQCRSENLTPFRVEMMARMGRIIFICYAELRQLREGIALEWN